MSRPKVAVEEQHKVVSVSLSPKALAHIAAFQAKYGEVHQQPITRSQAVETLILQSSLSEESKAVMGRRG